LLLARLSSPVELNLELCGGSFRRNALTVPLLWFGLFNDATTMACCPEALSTRVCQAKRHRSAHESVFANCLRRIDRRLRYGMFE
jgi:hypothetical protein